MPIKVDPGALSEVEDAALWYEQQEAGLAWEFFSAFASALDAIERNPKSFPMLEAFDSPEVRCCLLKPYAYRIGFRVTKREIMVFAVGHVRRGEAYWSRRLSQLRDSDK